MYKRQVKESDAYIALNIIITDPKIGIEAYKDAKKYVNEIEKIISLEVHKAIKQYTPQQYNEDVSEGEMNDIEEKKSLDDYRLLAIAEKIMNNTELLPNEAKLYEDPVYKEVPVDWKGETVSAKLLNQVAEFEPRNKKIMDIIEEYAKDPNRFILVLSDRISQLEWFAKSFDSTNVRNC